MKMRRRKRSQEHVNHERWLVSYADFITLMFALFVVLFSSSHVDQRKVTKLAAAIQTAFQQLGIFESAYKQPPLEPDGSIPVDQIRLVNTHVAPEQMFAAMDWATAEINERKSLDPVRRKLDSELALEIRRHVVDIQTSSEGLVIRLWEVGFYDSGSATLKPSAEPVVRRIAMTLLQRPENIRIEGDTDDVPIHNAQFSSNWELSAARATEMVRLFITQYGFPPNRLSAAGYAQYHPIASNATAAGRALNRRVDIVVPLAQRLLSTFESDAPKRTLPTPGQQTDPGAKDVATTPTPHSAASSLVTALPKVVSQPPSVLTPLAPVAKPSPEKTGKSPH
jgi:chemotaxis protein MotB